MPRKLDPDGRAYKKLADNVAHAYSPPIHQCQKCWKPTVEGYCCYYCGDSSPNWTKEYEAKWNEAMDKKWGRSHG